MSEWKDIAKLPIIYNENPGWGIETLEAKLLLGIKKCLPEKGPISISLSGGIDSTLISAMMVTIVEPVKPIKAFTITPAAGKHPDMYYAKLVSKVFGLNHYEIYPLLDTIKYAERETKKMFGKNVRKGDEAIFILYEYLKLYGIREIIACDGIDEIMGGYWDHRDPDNNFEGNQEAAFEYFWQKLLPNHLKPLNEISAKCGINVKFPYLEEEFVKYALSIPLKDRTDIDESKKPLRILAKKYGVPEEIINRKKIGFINALDNF